MNSSIARRYAKALFELGSDEGILEEVRSSLEGLSDTLSRHPILSEACLNPMFRREEHWHVLEALMTRQGCPPLVVRFMDLLVAKHRLQSLHDIVRHFSELVDQAQGIETVRVKAPKELSDGDKAALKAKLEEGLGRKVTLSIEQDPALIAGVAVQVGSQVYDGTVRGKLGALRKAMLRE